MGAGICQRQQPPLANYSVAESAPAKACESLSTFKGDDIVSIPARVVAATADTPQHCRVIGTITPEVAFEVNLPDRWNQRFYMTGNGGLAGDALDTPTNADRTSALTNGFVMARTNTGHDARKEPSGSFILSNPQKAIDYAYRAVHVTADTAKKIATDYYAKPITFSYWNSCSNGGRQGLLEAQRFPDDFDGIVANAPWVDQTGFTIGAIWNQKALTEAPVSLDKMTLVADKAMAKCDDVDGLKDGLIDDPRKCSFDPARDVPACSAGRRRCRLPDASAGGDAQEGLRRSGQQRQAVLPRLHGRQRGARRRRERRDGQRMGERDRRRRSRTRSRPTSISPKA